MRMLGIVAGVALASCGQADSAKPQGKAAPSSSKPMPQRTPGSKLVGTVAPAWQLAEWENSKPLTLAGLKGRVVVIRFWTNGCQYCVTSLPAMQQLAREFAAQPVTFIGAYHSKPFKSEQPWSQAVATARRWGVTFPLAYDRLWKTVFAWWLKGKQRKATSVSFVIDADGKFAHIHPGPAFYPSDKPYDKQEDADFRAMRVAINQALARRTARN